jgi:hypothetical protein
MFFENHPLIEEKGTGFRRYRFLGVVIFDTVLTFAAACIISYVLNSPLYLTVIVGFLTGIVVHRIFNVKSTIDKLVFPEEENPPYSHYLAKLTR